MIDIEFVIPICLNGKYLNRINNFLNYGIINLNNHSILITLLIDYAEINKINNLNIKNNVKIVECPLSHEACKVYHYFSNYPKENLNNVKWIAKIDDDSINDVDLLLKKLNSDFDWEKEYYLIAGCQQDIDCVEFDLLNELGYQDWFSYNFNHIVHEKEGSIISQAALKSILKNPLAIELLTKRAYIENGYTDQCLAAAARICKIYPVSPQFITYEPFLHQFSLFGGKLAHIHFIAEDIDKNIFNILKNKLNDLKSNESFVGKKFKFKNHFEEINSVISFESDYRIQAQNNFYWQFWSSNKNNITMHSLEGMPNITIELNDAKELKGDHGTILRKI